MLYSPHFPYIQAVTRSGHPLDFYMPSYRLSVVVVAEVQLRSTESCGTCEWHPIHIRLFKKGVHSLTSLWQCIVDEFI